MPRRRVLRAVGAEWAGLPARPPLRKPFCLSSASFAAPSGSFSAASRAASAAAAFLAASSAVRAASSAARWHFLYFLPDPQ